jgi:hypothetical protein
VISVVVDDEYVGLNGPLGELVMPLGTHRSLVVHYRFP